MAERESEITPVGSIGESTGDPEVDQSIAVDISLETGEQTVIFDIMDTDRIHRGYRIFFIGTEWENVSGDFPGDRDKDEVEAAQDADIHLLH